MKSHRGVGQSGSDDIGVPKEIKAQEERVALLPSGVYQLIQSGHEVIVEFEAGTGAGFSNDDYKQAGAQLESDHAGVFERSELIVKVKEPQPEECALFRKGQILFT